MKRMSLSGVTVAVALVTASCALAAGPETEKMNAMIRHIEFITQNSSLAYAGQDLPNVTFVSEDELQLLFRLSEADVHANVHRGSFAVVSAFYDRTANSIFVADATLTAGPGLFHEMVHFLQAINDKDDMFTSHRVCLEAEAYDLQAIWQTEQVIELASKPDYGFVMTL